MTPTFKVDKVQIRERKHSLEQISEQLKKDFVGIDSIIDSLLDYIQIWYIMPEILSRPIIVCLWGMTGVGKTDLVRKLVKYLNYQDRFAEVELGNSDNTSYYSSVSSILERNGINDGLPSIVLFDEIQRFNTIEPDGSPVPNTKFTDFWELLSDGRLAKREKDDLDWYVNEYLTNQRKTKKKSDKPVLPLPPNADGTPAAIPEAEVDPMTQEIGLWEAQNLKKMLSLEDEVVDLAEMNRLQMLERIVDAKKKKRIYEPIDHSKTLILISGNLDEAFQMAHQTSESDVDADIFHAFTKKITQVDVKNALSRRFRPEQVARFGNIHLIYTSLRKSNFEILIGKEIDKIVARTKEKFGITLIVSDNLHKLVYRNGVFPVQGVRPVFSSITDILETNLSKLMFEALLDDQTKVSIDYNFEKHVILGKYGKKEMKIPYVGRIDKIRQGNIEDVVSNVSVHEAGHAVAYVLLFGLAPLQLKSKVASSYAGGFTFPHQIYETKENLVKKITVYLAGGIAEELIFGDKNATVGRSHDREQATVLAMEYIRRHGFDDEFQANYTLEYAYAMDKTATDTDVEKMIARLVSETNKLLSNNQEFLMALSRKLYKAGSLEGKDVEEVASRFKLKANIKEEGYLHLPDYKSFMGK
jgi:hypothetical protein